MVSKTKKEAKEKLRTAIEEKNPKEIALATVDVLINSPDKIEELATISRMGAPLSLLDVETLVLLRDSCQYMIDAKEKCKKEKEIILT